MDFMVYQQSMTWKVLTITFLQVNFTGYTFFTDHSYSAFDFPVSELNLEESSIVCHPLIDNAKDISLFLGISHL